MELDKSANTNKAGLFAKTPNFISKLFRRSKGKPNEENSVTLNLQCLNSKYEDEEEYVNRGRKQEIKDVFDVLLKGIQHNIILVGPFGIGKNSIVEAVAERIAKGDCPEAFKSKRILQFFPEDLNPKLFSEDEVSGKIFALENYLKNDPNIILYIR